MHINEELMPFRFIYKNSKGAITKRSIVHISKQSDYYFAGIQELDGAIRTFRKEQIQEILDTDEKWLSCEAPEPTPEEKKPAKPKDPNAPSYINWDNKLEICFTGFPAEKRAELEKTGSESGLFVRKSVTANLSFLCTGPRAGPKKIASALEKGLVLMDEEAFYWFVETGEVPV